MASTAKNRNKAVKSFIPSDRELMGSLSSRSYISIHGQGADGAASCQHGDDGAPEFSLLSGVGSGESDYH